MSEISHFHENFFISRKESALFSSCSMVNLMFQYLEFMQFKNLVRCNSDEIKNVLSTYLLQIGL